VVRHPIPNSNFPIAQSVEVSGNTKTYYVGGQVSPVIDKDADPKSPQAYGDTKTQTVGVLNKINGILEAARAGVPSSASQLSLIPDFWARSKSWP
jgi:enamine deaminase RidA (YjgF/YER057c/UK114 family)